MRRSTKSVLLSALVLPGSGHFFLKHYLRGVVLMGGSLAGVTVIMVDTVQKSFVVIDTLMGGQGSLDADALSRMLTPPIAGSDSLMVTIATYGIGLCWVLGIIDSYRIGKRQDALNDREHQG